ncbi:MAG: carboxymuconolactone decarboxylase family protein [Novosphingobium sp.]|nr:carboxymuconolactone decarboxylase family protein [Novosphingobium sp.]MCP5401427.1 carboxymuconolactone decarboxylase family protein [Novosphingobium sp.]
MNDKAPRIPPLAPEDFTSEQAELVGDWTHLVFSRVIVRHPELYAIFVPYIERVIAGSILPARDREVLVLRTLGLSGETYETHHHEMIARNADMSEADIAAAVDGSDSLPPWEQTLMRAAEELVREQVVSDATWQALAERYSEKQLMEVVFLVGCYNTMAMLTRSFGMELEGAPDDFERIEKLRTYT